MPMRLFVSSGGLVADRRFDFARDLQLKGDLAAAADLLLQATELAPRFASAWFTLGEVRERLGERHAAIKAFRQARQADAEDRHAAVCGSCCLAMKVLQRCRRLMFGRCSINMRQNSRPRWSVTSAIAAPRFCSRRCWPPATPPANPPSSSRRSTSAVGPDLRLARSPKQLIISSASICPPA